MIIIFIILSFTSGILLGMKLNEWAMKVEIQQRIINTQGECNE